MPYKLSNLLEYIDDTFGEEWTFKRVCDALNTESLDPKTIFLRFDVERDLQHHLRIAETLTARKQLATFYFHTRRNCFDPETLKAIQELGHEVGYHHECLDRCQGNFEKAKSLFENELSLFQNAGINVFSVCSHGEAGVRHVGYSSNGDLFKRYPNLLQANNVEEVYHWTRSKRPLYASDTFKGHKNFWKTLRDAKTTNKPLMLLAHLHRWHDIQLLTAWEVTCDLCQQAMNRCLGKRTYNVFDK